MKKIMLSAFALVLGLGLAITQSSFKAANTTSRWGYDQLNQVFVDISGKTMDNRITNPAHDTYSCLSSAAVCSGDSDVAPSSTADLSNQTAGDFRYNP